MACSLNPAEAGGSVSVSLTLAWSSEEPELHSREIRSQKQKQNLENKTNKNRPKEKQHFKLGRIFKKDSVRNLRKLSMRSVLT